MPTANHPASADPNQFFRSNSSALDEAAHAVTHRARRAILHLLAVYGEVGRSTLDQALPLARRESLTKHLRVLRSAGLVTAEQSVFDRRELRYRLAPGALRLLHAWLAEQVLDLVPASPPYTTKPGAASRQGSSSP